MTRTYYDVSLTLSPDVVVYPGDPPMRIRAHLSISSGDPCNVSILEFGSHTGTHVDAPRHFIDSGATIDDLSLDYFLGPAKVFDLTACKAIDTPDLTGLPIAAGDRILLKTRNSHFVEESSFHPDFACLTAAAGRCLADIGIRTLGIDYLSIEEYGSPGFAAHQALLSRGVVLIEGLSLGRVPAGVYEMIALPLKIRGGDGSPVRVVLVEEAD